MEEARVKLAWGQKGGGKQQVMSSAPRGFWLELCKLAIETGGAKTVSCDDGQGPS